MVLKNPTVLHKAKYAKIIRHLLTQGKSRIAPLSILSGAKAQRQGQRLFLQSWDLQPSK